MKRGEINFPDSLVGAIRKGTFVVFAGAGASMGEPANLPSFNSLAKKVAAGGTIQQRENEPEDRFLGRLQHQKVDTHCRAANELSSPDIPNTELHVDLLRLFLKPEKVQLVTTNFDLLFENAAESLWGEIPEAFTAPALPRGSQFEGIVHVHGCVRKPHEMVLTDADFGRAYLTEGWARRFLLDVFRNHTVLFVGYSHQDVVMHYLSRAIPEHESGKRFALIEGNDDPGRWEELGIEPIPYPMPDVNDHSRLYEGVHLLADAISRSILEWKRNLIELAELPPPIESEQADEILYALEDKATTRIFVEYARASEWLSWLDSHKILDELFQSQELRERDLCLSWWIAEHYAIPHSSEVFLLISKHGLRLNQQFWWALGREVGIGDKYEISAEILSRWLSLLLETAPKSPDDSVLHWLGERCGKMDMLSSLLRMFEEMSKTRLSIKTALVWPGENDE